MNINVALKILLIISIVLQSFVAVSASTETHQLDVEHLQSIHDHEADHSPQLDSDNEHDIEDCHHCGHCSGNHTSWILVKAFTPNLSLNNSHNFDKLISLPLGTSTRLYRPPIA